jgi:hypothetical protein
MQNIPDYLARAPELAPGFLTGAAIGVIYGIWHDRQEGKGPMEGGSFWGYGTLGTVVGAIVWLWILEG